MPGHKAGKEFFEKKRPWSERKDLILDFYLKPYLTKISTLRVPILLIDGFAGPGEYGDGAHGSPLILARHARETLARRPRLNLKLICIEADPDLHGRLRTQLGGLDFAETRHGQFVEYVPELKEIASRSSTFLYLDPCTVQGLDWASLEELLIFLQEGRSVELLLNFNTPSFVRWGLQALRLNMPAGEERDDEDGEGAEKFVENPSLERLDDIVGGDWWREILSQPIPFPELVEKIAHRLEDRFHRWFNEVCLHAVAAEPHHVVPKYHLIFGSRHPDALRLMNDAMRKSQKRLAELANTPQLVLFERRPKRLVPDPGDLPPLILRLIDLPISRGELIEKVMRKTDQSYSETDIRRSITRLLEAGRLESESGRTRINDQERILPTAN